MALEKLTAGQVVEALQKVDGQPSKAADLLGVVTKTIYNYRDRYQVVADAMHHEKEKRIDHTEGKLFDRIEDGDTTAIIFYLKTQGKGRGYIERQDININVDVTKLDEAQLNAIIEA